MNPFRWLRQIAADISAIKADQRATLIKVTKMALQVDDLNTALDALATDVSGAFPTVIAELQAIEAKQDVDLSGPIAKVQAIKGAFDAGIQAAQTALTPPATGTGTTGTTTG